MWKPIVIFVFSGTAVFSQESRRWSSISKKKKKKNVTQGEKKIKVLECPEMDDFTKTPPGKFFPAKKGHFSN
jgi:hypothetical protein